MTIHDFEHAMAVNFWGMVHPMLAVLPEMRRRGSGRIVNITSIGGKVSVPHLLRYCAAKFAAVGFSEGLRAEVAGDGIRVVLMPAATVEVLTLANRLLLPRPSPSAHPVLGNAFEPWHPCWLRAATRLGRAAAREFQRPKSA